MSEFNASLIAAGDPAPIATTVAIEANTLELKVGTDSLGTWSLGDLGIERVLGGFRMNVEGESAVLRFDDPEPFANAIGLGTLETVKPPKRARKAKVAKKRKPQRSKAAKPVVAQPVDPQPAAKKQVPPRPKTIETPATTDGEDTVGWLDKTLQRGYDRWGRFVPDWVFTRGGVLVMLGVVLMLLAKPNWFSILFLIAAALGLAASAIALLDQVVATRIFKGGYTPIHGLVGSLALGLIGIILGAI